jgi:hypothetical protein
VIVCDTLEQQEPASSIVLGRRGAAAGVTNAIAADVKCVVQAEVFIDMLLKDTEHTDIRLL